jgi:hypothetical protein
LVQVLPQGPLLPVQKQARELNLQPKAQPSAMPWDFAGQLLRAALLAAQEQVGHGKERHSGLYSAAENSEKLLAVVLPEPLEQTKWQTAPRSVWT